MASITFTNDLIEETIQSNELVDGSFNDLKPTVNKYTKAKSNGGAWIVYKRTKCSPEGACEIKIIESSKFQDLDGINGSVRLIPGSSGIVLFQHANYCGKYKVRNVLVRREKM